MEDTVSGNSPKCTKYYHIEMLNDNRIYGEKIVAWLYLGLVATAILGDILYWVISKTFAGYAKIFFYTALAIIVIDLFKYKKIIKEKFLILLILYGGICFCIGLYNNIISREFFAHFLPFILPIFAYSYGVRSELVSGKLLTIINLYAIKAGYALVVLVAIYFSLVNKGYIEYFGAGALFAYPVFYAIKEKLYFSASAFYVANIFTGKRSVLIAITVVVAIYFYKKINTIGRLIFLGAAALISAYLYTAGIASDGRLSESIFDRFFVIFQYLSESNDVFKAIDLATSGRLYEVFAVIDRLDGSLFNWIFGMGFGAIYSIEYSFADEVHVTHYSHVTPFSYLLLGGVLLLIIVYAKLISEVKYAFKNIDNHLSMMIMYFFIIGFSGAIFFTDVFVWIIIGIFVGQRIKGRIATMH